LTFRVAAPLPFDGFAAMAVPREFDTFVQELTKHQSRLRGFIRCLLLRSEHVEDVLQETNLLLWNKADQFQPGTSFWAWASEVARYQVLTHWKKQGRDRHLFDDALVNQLAQEAQALVGLSEARRAALERCLEKLPAPQRLLLDRRYGLHEPIDTIAKSLDRPAGSLRQTLYRIREALLRCIENQLHLEGSA
jgi:RNA polymerase sigma-70 factor (ECF subfamily)